MACSSPNGSTWSLHHPDARVWEVTDADGSALGLFIGDFFARPTKAGGAWMNSIRVGAHAVDEQPVVTNNLNIVRPAEGPCLLTLSEVRTLFHEFGHALHGLFSAAAYPSLAGTAVPRDFVEYPSQVNEMWKLWPDIVAEYAQHHQTGEPLPDGALQRIQDASLWGEGFATTEYLSAALLDLAWHSLAADDTVDDILDFEDRALRDAGLDPDLVPPRYRTGYFKHIFDGGTQPATTPTSGARSWTPTRSSGSPRTAA
jgi:peptidyl-dipeptidase Dcp